MDNQNPGSSQHHRRHKTTLDSLPPEILKSLIRTAPSGFWVVDIHGNLVEVNDNYCKMSGYSREELLELHISDLDDNENAQEVSFHAEKVIEEGPQTFQSKHRRKDGTTFDVEMTASFLETVEGLFLVFCNDITKRLSSETLLKNSEERFQYAMEATSDGIFDWNLITNEIYYSPAWKKMLGYEYNELPNDFSVWETLTEANDVKEALIQQQDLVNRTIDKFEIEFKMKHKDGHWVEILSRAKAFFDENNKAVRIVGTHTDISERKKAETELRNSEKRYKQLFETNKAIKLLIDPNNGKIVEANLAACEYYGYSVEELTAMKISDINCLSEKEVANEMKRAKSTDKLYFEFKHKLASGEIRDVEVYSGPIISDKKTLLYSIIHDVTERHRALESLRKSERRFALSMEATSDGLWDWNIKTGEVYYSPAYFKMLGYEPDEFGHTVETWKSLILDDDRDETLRVVNLCVRNDYDKFEVEFRMITKNGHYRWIRGRGQAIERDENGFATRIVGTHTDITDSKERLLTIRRSEEKFFKTFYNAPLLMSISSIRDGKYLEINNAFERITGHERHNTIGKTSLEIGFISAGERDKIIRGLKISGRVEDLELMLTHADGSTIYCLYSGEIIYIDGKERLLSIAVDVTQRKREEAEKEVTINLLHLLGRSNGLQELMQTVASMMKDFSKCEAVGIRLKKDQDYPYFETKGIPTKFVALENHLCACDENGKIICDKVGNPVLECMCGNVINGQFDPSLKFFTEYGSFWTNSTTELLMNTTEEDRQSRTRNRCNGEGYESVALVPIRQGDTTFGLLQFNDHRKDCFNKEKIELFERLAINLAIGLAQKEAQRKELESEKRFRTLVEQAPFGIYETDARGSCVYVNKAWQEAAGLSLEEALGDGWQKGLYKDDREKILRKWKKNSENGKEWNLEYRFQNAKGIISWISGRTVPLLDEDNKITGYLGINANITETKLAQMELAESEKRHRILIEHQKDLIIQFDTDKRVIYVSPTYCSKFGLEEKQILGKTFLPLVHEDDRNVVEESLKNLNSPPFETQHEERVKTPEGWRWFEWSARGITDSSGALESIISVGRDITERKEAEIALKQSEERFRQLFENAPLGYQSLDEQGNFIEVNGTWCKILGYKKEEVIGRNFSEFIHPDFKEHFRKNFPNFKSMGYILGVEFEMIHKDGHEVIVSFDGRIGKNEDGSFKQTHCVLSDITARKKTEEDKLKLEEQLLHAQKMESIGRLAGGVAHDFNNLLSIILGNIDLAQIKLENDHPLQEELGEIRIATNQSVDLVRQLLGFARKQTIQPRIMNINSKIDSQLKMLVRLIGENIELSWKPSEENWEVKMDPTQLDQILTNLVVNAKDAIYNAGKIEIETENVDFANSDVPLAKTIESGEFVKITVSDNGSGIDEEVLKHIFDPFYTTKEKERGTGLGLATVYGIVKQNKGEILVESAPGSGTRFQIYLPRNFSKPHSVTWRKSKKNPIKGTETIIIVEDETSLLRISERILQELGYKTYSANGPAKALELIKTLDKQPDLLITDIIMPEMNGKILGEKIREVFPSIKCLFISGYSEEIIAKEGFLADEISYLPKPFTTATLSEKVREVLDKY